MHRYPNIGSMRLIRRGAIAWPLLCPLFIGAANAAPYRSGNNFISSGLEFNEYKIADSSVEKKSFQEDKSEPLVLISEVVIDGIEGHPDQKRLEYAAYDAMSIRPGSRITRKELQDDLNAIYATGWFSSVAIDPVNSALGVQLLVKVKANPSLTKVELNQKNTIITQDIINSIFKSDFGRTLNLNVLQLRMRNLKNWYSKNGYSLARISGPNKVTADGLVLLNIIEGTIEGIEIKFLDSEGNTVRENGKPVRGKTRNWVVEREMQTKSGVVFNRNILESDIKRLYKTALFSDVKVTLKPVPKRRGSVILVLGITEQRTGSLTGGIGYSGAQGVFGQAGLQETNLLGRSWTADFNFTYGEYGTLINMSLADPWIKGDKYRTSFRTNVYISRDVPQAFRSKGVGNIFGASDYYKGTGDNDSSTAYDTNFAHTGINGTKFPSVNSAKASNPDRSWFDYEGDSIVLRRAGGGFSFSRPFNGGDPFKKVPWSVLYGMNFQKVEPINYAGDKRPYGVPTNKITSDKTVTNSDIVCIAYNCAEENTLVSLRSALAYSNLNDNVNPTDGEFWRIDTEQFVSVGDNSPTFNKSKTQYSYFIPVNFLKLHKGCRPKKGEKIDCPQTVGFHMKAGSIVGDLPPYEAFCLGGSKSVRGWSSCDLGVSRHYGEGSAEYRFPIWRMVSGNLFFDAGTDFGSQEDVPGKPGKLLEKQGSGYSVGSGLSFKTPLGPLRLEAASKDFDGDWRYNFGFGWKF